MAMAQQALGMVETRGLTAAIEAADAMTKAAEVTLVEIARPTEDTEKMLKISAFDKGTPHKVNEE